MLEPTVFFCFSGFFLVFLNQLCEAHKAVITCAATMVLPSRLLLKSTSFPRLLFTFHSSLFSSPEWRAEALLIENMGGKYCVYEKIVVTLPAQKREEWVDAVSALPYEFPSFTATLSFSEDRHSEGLTGFDRSTLFFLYFHFWI